MNLSFATHASLLDNSLRPRIKSCIAIKQEHEKYDIIFEIYDANFFDSAQYKKVGFLIQGENKNTEYQMNLTLVITNLRCSKLLNN